SGRRRLGHALVWHKNIDARPLTRSSVQLVSLRDRDDPKRGFEAEGLGLAAVASLEPIDAALGVDGASLTRPERVRLRRDVEPNDRQLLAIDDLALAWSVGRIADPLFGRRRVVEED